VLTTELVRRGARRHGAHTAVMFGYRSLSFAEVAPDVTGAAVVGAPDATWVEAVTAFVTLRPGAAVTPWGLQDAVRSVLAGYKVPKSVQVVDAQPLSPVGKVLRRALREPLSAGTEGRR
jgi:acyl-CoA synthetase (AMP-forming)/AMP-acid ligase II